MLRNKSYIRSKSSFMRLLYFFIIAVLFSIAIRWESPLVNRYHSSIKGDIFSWNLSSCSNDNHQTRKHSDSQSALLFDSDEEDIQEESSLSTLHDPSIVYFTTLFRFYSKIYFSEKRKDTFKSNVPILSKDIKLFVQHCSYRI